MPAFVYGLAYNILAVRRMHKFKVTIWSKSKVIW